MRSFYFQGDICCGICSVSLSHSHSLIHTHTNTHTPGQIHERHSQPAAVWEHSALTAELEQAEHAAVGKCRCRHTWANTALLYHNNKPKQQHKNERDLIKPPQPSGFSLMWRETVWIFTHKETSDLIAVEISFSCLRSEVALRYTLFPVIMFTIRLFAFNSFCLCVFLLIAQIAGGSRDQTN